MKEIYEEILATREGEMDEEMSLNKMWMVFGQAPRILELFWPHMRDSYRGTSLPFELTSKVSLVTATVMECEGCRFFHTDRLQREGVGDNEIEQMRQREIEESAFSEREFEILRFAEQTADDPHSISESDIERLRDVGLSETEIVELIDCIAVHVYTAVFQEATGVVSKGMAEQDYLGQGTLPNNGDD
ncbi:carboxymuconolactone decarboxylase family protein [Haladaptatus caseinilyticus]|uniref:carboxymuconolactone decarboxylase family protein n=1 Tax=Haladaptatus caseinilyticus TaxID=2993314 RepID=UPI00224B0F48|nr:hypothetical protein [Haladaptatus caseinilyticus]